MPKRSAGILLWRREADGLAVLLALPGGPYTRGDGDGEWQIPKGGVEPGESARAAAMREFAEETGFAIGTEPVPPRYAGELMTAMQKLDYVNIPR